MGNLTWTAGWEGTGRRLKLTQEWVNQHENPCQWKRQIKPAILIQNLSSKQQILDGKKRERLTNLWLMVCSFYPPLSTNALY